MLGHVPRPYEALFITNRAFFSVNGLRYVFNSADRCRINCLRYSWVIDLDIKGFFDNIDHDLMMLAVRRFTNEECILIYVERWLKAPVRLLDGTLKESNGRGTTQGGVISPLLADICLHVAFDMWFSKNYPEGKFERYADDIIVHCDTFTEAQERLNAIEQRLNECKLELNRSKTKIVHLRGDVSCAQLPSWSMGQEQIL